MEIILRREAFSPGQKKVLLALCEQIFASDGPEEISPGHSNLADKISSWLTDIGTFTLFGLKFLLWFINWFPFFFIYRARRFVSLSRDEQELMLQKLANHRISLFRFTLFGPKMLFSIVYWDEPGPLEEAGHDTRCLKNVQG